jgi:hypothetical protein
MTIVKDLKEIQKHFKRPPEIARNDWKGIPAAVVDVARKTWERTRHRSHSADDEMLETMLLKAIIEVRNE